MFSSLATWSKVSALAAPSDTPFVFVPVRFSFDEGLVHQATPKDEYTETVVDGAHFFVNPHAAAPLDPEVWQRLGFGVHRHRPDGTFTGVPEGMLIHRCAWRFGTYDPEAGPRVSPNVAPTGTTPHVRTLPPDGVLFGGPSKVPDVEDIEMMLYRGWTVVIGRFSDGDGWTSRFRRGTFLSLNEYFVGDLAEEASSPLRPERDLLIAETQNYIDRINGGGP